MRELIYVSDAKLRQLLPGLPRRASRLRDVEAEINTPLGGFKVGKGAAEPEPSLAAAVAALEASSRAPRWFADPAVRPGHWVHFEAPMSYGTYRGSAVFVDYPSASTEYPTGGRLRLVLHGSVSHLLGAPTGPGLDDYVDRPTGSLRAPFFRESRSDAGVPDLGSLEDGAADDAPKPSEATEKALRTLSRYTAEQARVYATLRRMHEDFQGEYTAAWVAGYARITARIPMGNLLLAATPLYVEHIDPPGDFVEPAR